MRFEIESSELVIFHELAHENRWILDFTNTKMPHEAKTLIFISMQYSLIAIIASFSKLRRQPRYSKNCFHWVIRYLGAETHQFFYPHMFVARAAFDVRDRQRKTSCITFLTTALRSVTSKRTSHSCRQSRRFQVKMWEYFSASCQVTFYPLSHSKIASKKTWFPISAAVVQHDFYFFFQNHATFFFEKFFERSLKLFTN